MPRLYGRRARLNSVAARSGSEIDAAAPGGPPRSLLEVDALGSTPGTGAPASGKTLRRPTASLPLLRGWAGRRLSVGHAAEDLLHTRSRIPPATPPPLHQACGLAA